MKSLSVILSAVCLLFVMGLPAEAAQYVIYNGYEIPLVIVNDLTNTCGEKVVQRVEYTEACDPCGNLVWVPSVMYRTPECPRMAQGSCSTPTRECLPQTEYCEPTYYYVPQYPERDCVTGVDAFRDLACGTGELVGDIIGGVVGPVCRIFTCDPYPRVVCCRW